MAHTISKYCRAILRNALYILILCFCLVFSVSAQRTKKHKNAPLIPVPEKPMASRDSAKIYKDLERFSHKHKVLHELYKSVFRLPPAPIVDSSTLKKKNKTSKSTVRPLEYYKGHIIRNVEVSTMDPLGFNIYDSTSKPTNFFEKAGNVVHLKSTDLTIKNHILFAKGDSLDPLKIRESERLIRTSGYVRDALITVIPIKGTDSVDVFIMEQDRWSLIVSGTYGSRSAVNIRDNNFLGLGHQVQQSFLTRGILDSAIYFQGSYGIQYIRNTFITAGAFYNTDPENTNRGIGVNRSFVSPLTAWAGGVQVASYKMPVRVGTSDTTSRIYKPEYTSYDAWLGYSLPLGAITTDKERATRLIITGGYLKKEYLAPVPIEYDPLYTFQTSERWLLSMGVSKRTYYKDSYIYRFGTTEDVPTGFLISGTIGVQRQPSGYRKYIGVRGGGAIHVTRVGYFNLFGEAGGYPLDGYYNQAVLRAKLGYFTDLVKIGSWKIRQFIVAESVVGLHRYKTERININGQAGLPGFDSPILNGTNKFLMYIQTQLYLPYTLIGFRFAPVLYLGLGSIGDDQSWFIKNKVYPVLAVGVQIRNEFLVFSTFQFTIGFYPDVPGATSSFYKLNPLSTTDIQFQQLQMGRPETAVYD